MARRDWQLAAFLLTILLVVLVAPQAQRNTHAATPSVAPETLLKKSDSIFDPNFVPTDEERENYHKNEGNAIVHEIWSILRDHEPTWKDSVSSPQITSHADTIWYYLKATFRLLFMNGPAKRNGVDDGQLLKRHVARATEGLKHAASFDDKDAIFLLAEMSFHGNFSHPRDFQEAFRRYSDLAELDGNNTAQYMIGLMYATGLGGAVEKDQAKALLYHTFAAEQGNVRSEMTLAYRHRESVGTPRDCDKSAQYYKRVADKAMALWWSGPPGGHTMLRHSHKWSDPGGVYGEGASHSSSGHNALNQNQPSMEDILEYLEMKERQGDYGAVFTLGKHYYDGQRGYRRNMKKAHKQFMKIARVYWTKDGKVNPKGPKGIEKVAGKAAAYIGRMSLRGEGMEQNFEKAATWFRRGIVNGDPFCQYHMGLMYRDGHGVPKDAIRAASFFKAAAEQNLHMAMSAIGVMFLDQGDLETAGRYFELAAASGVMEGYYYLAEMTNKGVGRERNCGLATAYYKAVAERVELLHSSFVEANAAYERGDLEHALVVSIMAAEQGYESAQANVAYLLDVKTSILSLPSWITLPSVPSFISTKQRRRDAQSLLEDPGLALIYYTRAGNQRNTDALVKMGDYYLSGLGTESRQPDAEKASTCYTQAAEQHHSAQSMWNLGWMHENGIGPIEQDFHMAKRYYDLALELNKEAYLPVKLALGKLRLRSWWNGVSGGTVNPIRDEPDPLAIDEDGNPKKTRTFTEWVAHFLDAAEEMDAAEAERLAQGDVDMDFGGSGDFGSDPMPGGDEAYFDDFDDGLVESLVIIGLAATLAFLVWYRQQQQQINQLRNGQVQRQQGRMMGVQRPAQDGGAQAPVQGQGRGLFPNPGDPQFGQWVAGGVGH